MPAAISFLDRVNKNGPIHSVHGQCWLWTGSKGDGYGRLIRSGKLYKAHRYSWMFHNGPVSIGLSVLHHCDTPLCVNPSHLFLGTQADNISDMVAKERQSTARGEDSGRAKLTDEQVLEIRRRYLYGSRRNGQVALSREFGVSQPMIGYIVRGEAWKHLR